MAPSLGASPLLPLEVLLQELTRCAELLPWDHSSPRTSPMFIRQEPTDIAALSCDSPSTPIFNGRSAVPFDDGLIPRLEPNMNAHISLSLLRFGEKSLLLDLAHGRLLL